MKITDVFATHIRNLRHQNKLSQEELALRSGLHRTYIGAVERGERNITILSAQKIVNALDTTLDKCLIIPYE